MRGSGLLLVFLASIVLQSCADQPFFTDRIELPADGWDYENQINFTIPVSDTSGRFDLLLDIDHSPEYLFQNIYLNIFTMLPDGSETSQQLPIDFADKIGNWYGDCNRSSCDLRVTLQERTYFNQIGDYRITLEQATRKNPLLGIESLTLSLINAGTPTP